MNMSLSATAPRTGKETPAHYRKSSREWVFTLDAFKALDYGKVCQTLNLRPSKPYKPQRRQREAKS